MPLPLPNLDTRRWADLVEEGRALIPRYAPSWTDHNVHDPGITLIELFAWYAEGAMYRANRISDSARRKYLSFIGCDSRQPKPAELLVGFHFNGAGPVELPPELLLEHADADLPATRARLTDAITLVPGSIVALLISGGGGLVDRSRALDAPLGLPLFGDDPAVGAAFMIGLDQPLPVGVWTSIGIELTNANSARLERSRFFTEAAEKRARCARPPRRPCTPRCGHPCDDEATLGLPNKEPRPQSCSGDSPRVEWDYFGPTGWSSVGAANLRDETEALTWSGIVHLRLDAPMMQSSLGGTAPRYWLRCRLINAAYDSAPRLGTIALNAAVVTQDERPLTSFVIDSGAVLAGAPPIALGTDLGLDLSFIYEGRVGTLTVAPEVGAAPLRAIAADFVPPAAGADGSVQLTLIPLGAASGLPRQRLQLRDREIVDLALWTYERSNWRGWSRRISLDASSPTDPHFTLNATEGEITFGDGERGRIPDADSPVLVSYRYTRGAAGSIGAGVSWRIADTPISRAVLGAGFAAAVQDVVQIDGLAVATPGRDEESLAQAARRAAEALWSHEQLVLLSGDPPAETLDQIDPDAVRAATVPARGATSLDLERLTLQVPGTCVRRARAWPSLDPLAPGTLAIGTVTVVVMPELPAGRPVASPRLLRRVRRYLARRCIVGTRLVVTGATYVEISVTATVTALPGADQTRVSADVTKALNSFLDPLTGGPAQRGWPFGRDVYRSEVLATIDGVRGVDHVLSLSMTADGRAIDCGNACIPPVASACAGQHSITVAR
jgi:baseplate J-like protein